MEGFTFRRKGAAKKKAAPARKKAKAAQSPARKKAKKQAVERGPLPAYPTGQPFEPKVYDAEMPAPAARQRYFEDLLRSELKYVKETYGADHPYIPKALSAVADEFLNKLRERTTKQADDARRDPVDAEIAAWRELEEGWVRQNRGALKTLGDVGDKYNLTPSGESLGEIYSETVTQVNIDGDEILRKLRDVLRKIKSHFMAQNNVAETFNHKAFKLYADVDAPKSLLEQFSA